MATSNLRSVDHREVRLPSIPLHAWEPALGLGGRTSRGRLYATVRLGSLAFHVDAVEVKQTERGYQEAATSELEGILADYFSAAGGDGPFETTEIGGKAYAVFMTPFCR